MFKSSEIALIDDLIGYIRLSYIDQLSKGLTVARQIYITLQYNGCGSTVKLINNQNVKL